MDRIHLVDEYPVAPYTIQIYSGSPTKSLEKLYVPRLALGKSQDLLFLDKIKKETITRLKSFQKAPYIVKLEELSTELDYLIKKVVEDLNIKIDLFLLRFIRYQILGFSKILPLLLDQHIEEIYLDNLQTPIYVDHAQWGRCQTNIYLANEDAQRLITRARIEGNAPLNRGNPSLKTDLVTQDFTTRISIDMAPLVIEGIHFDIRKLSLQPRTLQDLIQNQTLPPIVAAYLVFLLLHRCNIAVIGEPGSGKTTLMNALDLLTPRHWRKITIEDIIESIDQSKLGFHQVRFKVDPIEKERKTSTKSLEIVKLLHRSPDWVYLGEIQTEEQTKALFHALSTGLRGIFSYHATSPEHLVIRSTAHYKIPPISLHALDVIVQMKKTWKKNKLRRFVYRISEIGELPEEQLSTGLQNAFIEIKDIFRFQPSTSQLERVADLYTTPTLEQIKTELYINKTSFYKKLKALSGTLSVSYQTENLNRDLNRKIRKVNYNLPQLLLNIIHNEGGKS
ncbi:MAG: ATPase, T2SS/T4P/T4SS family [Candidatus Heimdallarchaeota archaeon]